MTRAIKPFGYHLILATALAAAPAIAADAPRDPIDAAPASTAHTPTIANDVRRRPRLRTGSPGQ